MDASAKAKAKSKTQDLHRLLDAEWQYQLRESPEWATQVGVKTYDDRWSDYSDAALERRKKHELAYLAALQAIKSESLSPREQLFRALALAQAEKAVEEHAFPTELLPITQLEGPQNSLPRVLMMQEKTSEADYRAVLARLHSIPLVIDQTIERMKKGLEQGLTPPQITLRDVAAQIEAQIPGDPLQSPVLESFKTLPSSIPIQKQEELRAEALRAYKSDVKPAFQKLLSYFKTSYYPKARESVGLFALPQGEKWYQFQVKSLTTTDLSPEAIHAVGLKEVARIRGEMEAIIKEVGYSGSFAAFLKFLRDDPQFFYASKDELLTASRAIAKQIDPELTKVFGKLPRLPYGVVPVPTYIEKSQPIAYYQTGSAGRAGYFFLNTFDLKSQPKWGLESLILHESVPGHHLQLALAQERGDVPELLKHSHVTAFIEGWGLYAESLGKDLGLYQDPYVRFGQLTYEMWRAVRLVVDTGIHFKQWSRQQGLDFFRENTGKSEHDIEVEVDRYIVWPGQALAYKMGELKIKELRARAQSQLGPAFDLRKFHDEVLANGSVPLRILEQEIDRWIAKAKGS